MKILGAVLIVGGSFYVGLASVFKLRRRVECISGIIQSLTLIKSEICTSFMPVFDTLITVSAYASNSTKNFFDCLIKRREDVGTVPFGDMWRDSVIKNYSGILNIEEISVLNEVGQSLGKYDAEWQSEAINRAINRFEVFEHDAKIIRDRDSKAHAALGIAAGIFAVIILI